MHTAREESALHRAKRKTILLLVTFCILSFGSAMALGACAPTAHQSSSNQAATAPTGVDEPQGDDSAVSVSGTVNFLENNSGDYPDTFTNTQMLNAGNRGCNACHEDLFDAMKLLDPEHIVVGTGYGKQGTIHDCLACHVRKIYGCGPYLADVIHGSHYSNETFVENNGNCWSCHAMTNQETRSRAGDYNFVLWEDVKYLPTMGGYNDSGTEGSIWWEKARGYDTGFFNGITADTRDDKAIAVNLDQKLTDKKDMYIVNNFVRDMKSLSSTENNLSITGNVANPREFTYEELQAMPQQTVVCTQVCSTNGLGGSLLQNLEFTGVPLSYLVEQCGGLTNGANQAMFNVNLEEDAERKWNAPNPVDLVMDNIIALQINGEPLDENWGPIVNVPEGIPGAAWIKHLSNIDFSTVETPVYKYDAHMNLELPDDTDTHYWLNAGFFENDGITFSQSEGVDLTGWAMGWTGLREGLEVASVSFSVDMGETWVDFDVPDDFDPNQWVTFDFHWDPPEPGTYVVKVTAHNANGDTIKNIGCANLLVTVTE